MTAPARPGGELVRRLLVPLAAMVVAFGAGWSLGAGGQHPAWQDAKTSVDGTKATVRVGGSTYTLDGAVPAWVDAKGAQHGSGWPTCLADLDGRSGAVKVVLTSVTVDKSTIDAVLAVDCRA